VEDILGHIPLHTRATVCGDWNARIGNLHPKFGHKEIYRTSDDETKGNRARWVLDICEDRSWYILNGLQPGPPAQCTYEKGLKKSCIDLILATDHTQPITYDTSTLGTISDHALVKTSIRI
jgi:Endonuclease-reverse transcriptase